MTDAVAFSPDGRAWLLSRYRVSTGAWEHVAVYANRAAAKRERDKLRAEMARLCVWAADPVATARSYVKIMEIAAYTRGDAQAALDSAGTLAGAA